MSEAGLVESASYKLRLAYIDALSRGENASEAAEVVQEEKVDDQLRQRQQEANIAWLEGATLTKETWIDHYLARLPAAHDLSVRCAAARVLDELEGIISNNVRQAHIVDALRLFIIPEEQQLLLHYLRHTNIATSSRARQPSSTHALHYGFGDAIYVTINNDIGGLYRRLQLDITGVLVPPYQIRELIPSDDNERTLVNAFLLVSNGVHTQDVMSVMREYLQLACGDELLSDDVFTVSRCGIKACINTSVVMPFSTLKQLVLPLVRASLSCRIPNIDWTFELNVLDRELNQLNVLDRELNRCRCATLTGVKWTVDGSSEALYHELVRTSSRLIDNAAPTVTSDTTLREALNLIVTGPVKVPRSTGLKVYWSLDESSPITKYVQRVLSEYLSSVKIPQQYRGEVSPMGAFKRQFRIPRIYQVVHNRENGTTLDMIDLAMRLVCDICHKGHVCIVWCFHPLFDIGRSCSNRKCFLNPFYKWDKLTQSAGQRRTKPMTP